VTSSWSFIRQLSVSGFISPEVPIL